MPASASSQPAPHKMAPSKFFLLPREIRDLIYSALYESCNQPGVPIYSPALYSKDQDGDPNRVAIVHDGRNWKPLALRYPKTYPRYTLLPILQASRQTRAEFSELLERKNGTAGAVADGLRYELDLIAPKTRDEDIRTTWTVLPLPPEKPWNVVEELLIKYRYSDFDGRGTGFYSGCGGPGLITVPLFRLFNDFFCHGPQGFYDENLNTPDLATSEIERSIWPGGRCKPFIKTMVFEVTFEYSQETLQDLENNRRVVEQELEWEEERILSGLFRFIGQLHGGSNYFTGRIGRIVVFASNRAIWDGRHLEETRPDRNSWGAGEFHIKKGLETLITEGSLWKPYDYFEDYGYRWGPRPQSTVRSKCPYRPCVIDKKFDGIEHVH